MINDLVRLLSGNKGRDVNRGAILLAVLWCIWKVDKVETRVATIESRLPVATINFPTNGPELGTNVIAKLPQAFNRVIPTRR